MVLWLSALSGVITLPTRFHPVSWHAHEFLFGYLGAVLAGFLLTAVPNWTGRLPMVGWRLAALFGLWIAGRAAILFSSGLPVFMAPTLDLAFPLMLAMLILREIVAGKNWRNLVVLALLGVFTLANALFHIEAMTGQDAATGYGLRLGLATAVMMIAVIGGRIIPSFTRNWLAQTNRPACPTPPMQSFDKFVLVSSVIVLLLWVVLPTARSTGVLLIAAGVLHLARQARWQAHHTAKEPLVWVLHASYAFIPAGALGMGTGLVLGDVSTAAAQHLWMAGAVGAMTLAVMTRATLGHTGRKLTADRATVVIYLCLFAAVGARMLAPALPLLSYLSGFLWLAAFGGFAAIYGPYLMSPKPHKNP